MKEIIEILSGEFYGLFCGIFGCVIDSILMITLFGKKKYSYILPVMLGLRFMIYNVGLLLIANHFFGEMITVSGLVTGTDLKEQLKGVDLGERLLLPCNMLRSGEDIFLDDVSVKELERELGTEIVIVDENGADLVSSILDPPNHNKQIRRQIYEQTSSSDCGKA